MSGQRSKAPLPCAFCGAPYHQPYDDGLVECRDRLFCQLESARDALTILIDDVKTHACDFRHDVDEAIDLHETKMKEILEKAEALRG